MYNDNNHEHKTLKTIIIIKKGNGHGSSAVKAERMHKNLPAPQVTPTMC